MGLVGVRWDLVGCMGWYGMMGFGNCRSCCADLYSPVEECDARMLIDVSAAGYKIIFI